MADEVQHEAQQETAAAGRSSAQPWTPQAPAPARKLPSRRPKWKLPSQNRSPKRRPPRQERPPRPPQEPRGERVATVRVAKEAIGPAADDRATADGPR